MPPTTVVRASYMTAHLASGSRPRAEPPALASEAPRLRVLAAMGARQPPAESLQIVGRWDILHATPDELMLSLTADQPLFAGAPSIGGDQLEGPASGVRPVFAPHCRGGATSVFLEPPEKAFVLRFDDGPLIAVRYTESFKRGADRPPLLGIAEPEDIVRSMLAHTRLEILDRQPGGGRTFFTLEGLRLILTELGDPCGWLDRVAETP